MIIKEFLKEVKLPLEWKLRLKDFIYCTVAQSEDFNIEESKLTLIEYVTILNDFWVEEYDNIYFTYKDYKEKYGNIIDKTGIDEIVTKVVSDFIKNIEENNKPKDNVYWDMSPEEKPIPTEGFVYIAKQTNEKNIYKFGITRNIKNREQTFKIGNVFISMIASLRSVNYRKIERIIHSRLKEFNISGEWFDIPSEYISEIIKEYGFTRYLEDNK